MNWVTYTEIKGGELIINFDYVVAIQASEGGGSRIYTLATNKDDASGAFVVRESPQEVRDLPYGITRRRSP